MKICAFADIHGQFPKVPKCDVFIIAGDICSIGSHSRFLDQMGWLRDTFAPWLESIDVKHKIIVWGNHDWAPERVPHLMPKLPCHVLTDAVLNIDGINFYGSPWQLRFHDWAFNLDEPDLKKKYAKIPEDTHVLISHGPPHGYGDKTYSNEFAGSLSLTEAIVDKKINLTITGHIHPAYGQYKINDTSYVFNCSLVDSKYKPATTGFEIELNDKGEVISWEGKLKHAGGVVHYSSDDLVN